MRAIPALFATLALALAPLAARADDAVPAVTKDRVEMVFVLDTTGSMGGLIDGAKRKIWFIANEVLKAKRQPDLKIGLVAYRDKGDEYVTKVLPLTRDLDLVYDTLMGYRAGGGGDGPEHVNAALHAAVHEQPWSDDNGVLKLIFLVGDAPPHMDYGDDVKHALTSQIAVRRNIYINTLQCGGDPTTRKVWTEIAHNSEGRFAAIPQDGGVVAIATPYDAEIGRLAAALDRTEVAFGARDKRERKKALLGRASSYAAAAPPSTAAERGMAKAKSAPVASEDLVSLYETRGGAALADLDDALLPEELQGKSDAEVEAWVEKKKAERAELRKQILAIEKKRAAYLEEKRKEQPKDAFDAEVIDIVRAQGKRRGLAL